jgi:hypothetical protein
MTACVIVLALLVVAGTVLIAGRRPAPVKAVPLRPSVFVLALG